MLQNFVCLVAKTIVRDSQTQNVTVVSIFEEFHPEGFPVFVPEIGVLAMWRREEDDPQKQEIQFTVLNNERELFAAPVEVDFEESEPVK